MSIRTVFVLFLAALSGNAQFTGTFTATGRMTTARFDHTATLLNDGAVLIAGGSQLSPPPEPVSFPLSSAEIYDPSAGAFTATGNLTAPRSGHTATLLPDGTVHIVGGGAGHATEIYDPSTRSFTAIQDTVDPRTAHTATLLGNGKVLIAGGDLANSYTCTQPLASAELYDPLTGAFTLTGNMTTGHCSAVATLLSSGKVLIVPGGSGNDYASAELYDPDTGTFTAADWENQYDIVAGTANLLPNGRVLITLNLPGCDWLNQTAKLFDSPSGTFAPASAMVYGICAPSGTTLSDGSVLIAGGRFGLVPGGQLYDPGSGIFTPTANMIVSRGDHAAVLLNDGSVLISGGTASNSPTLDSAEIYHPAIVASPPALLSVIGGKGQGAILHRTSQQIISAANPAIAGEILEIYSTGLLSASVIPPEVSIGGRMAEVLFFGKARRFGGLYQINVRVPTGIAPSGSVPVRMTYLSRPSNEVTIPIQ